MATTVSVDYEKLRADLDEIQAGVNITTRYTWADLARELLRLHDGLEQLVDSKRPAAELMRKRANTNW